jgi:hypothetical protein
MINLGNVMEAHSYGVQISERDLRLHYLLESEEKYNIIHCKNTQMNTNWFTGYK